MNEVIRIYIKKSDENKWWDFSDKSFKDYANITRTSKEIDEHPDQPGIWHTNIDMGTHTGKITIIPRNAETNLIAGEIKTVYLINGEPAVKLERDKRELHENYGGMDNLRYVNNDGEPIEGASIRVYTKQQFDNGNKDNPIGTTMTDKYGSWVNPVPVNTGNEYVIVFHKESSYGPDNVQLTVS